MQAMINAKAAGKGSAPPNNDTSMFGKPQRIPQQLDDSMLYDPKAIQYNPSNRGSKNLIGDIMANPLQPTYVVEQSIIPIKQPVANQAGVMQEGRDSYVRPLKLQHNTGQDPPSPRLSYNSYRPNYMNEEDEFRKMIMDNQQADMRGDLISPRKGNESSRQRGTVDSRMPQAGRGLSEELITENARLKVQNQALLAENGSRLAKHRVVESTKERANDRPVNDKRPGRSSIQGPNR